MNAFLEAQILGIMANFSEVLDAPRANQPLLERKRCVGAIGEIISLAKDDTSLALPQVILHPLFKILNNTDSL